MTHAESKLRQLCAWYEWSSPPNAAAADLLQGAADELAGGNLSDETAEAVIAAWQPFSGFAPSEVEPPPVGPDELGLRRAILADLRRMIDQQTDPERRLFFTHQIEAQVRTFRKAGR